jgi:hypothetical protein
MKKKTVVAADWGDGRNRDRGKTFLLTEMSAFRAEKWLIRVSLALNKGGGQLPLNAGDYGPATVAIMGINTFLRGNVEFADIEPLLDEMMTCVQMIRDPKAHPDVVTEFGIDGDVEEVQTLLWLRSEVIELHTGFSVAGAVSTLLSMIMTPPASSTTQTSPETAGSSSAKDSPA